MPFPSLTSDLLARIPLSARTILEAGCTGESLASAYQAMNPKARILGIELKSMAGTCTAQRMNDVVAFDPVADPLPFEVPEGIDCIVYSNFLEHLRDPWTLIQRHAEALSADGMMLVCVPNTEHWRLAERLLRGISSDEATGVQHAAPSQLFSLESMREWFARADLTLCDVTTREPDAEAAAQFVTALGPALEALGIDPSGYAKRASASHLIWRVRKEPRERMIVAGSMLDPVGGVSHVRVVYPLRAIGTDPMVTVSITDRVGTDTPSDGVGRIFVLHRPTLIGQQGHQILQGLAMAGFLIVTEFDDLPSHFKMMQLGGELSFYGVHALQTSTLALAAELRSYNPEVAVFPNAVPTLPNIDNFADPTVMTLFFGALNREQDWLPFMPAINAVAALAKRRLKFEVVHDQAFFDALQTPHKSFTPTCDYPTYLRLLGGCEISFMPLSDTAFNRAKSDLKFIEAGACRVAALASSVVYGDSIHDGQTGLLFRNPAEFHARLLRLVAMPETALAIGEAARQYVANERMLAYQVAPRITWYRSLWAKRAALINARRERMSRYHTAA